MLSLNFLSILYYEASKENRNLDDQLDVVERQARLTKALRDIAVYELEEIAAIAAKARMQTPDETPEPITNE